MTYKKLSVWVFQTGEIIPITGSERLQRSGRLVIELAQRGHLVTWWTSAFDHHSKRWIESQNDACQLTYGITLRMLRGCGYKKNVSLRRYVDHYIVARSFERKCLNLARPDILIINLPDHQLGYAAARWANRFSIPYVLDLRDRWPLDILDRLKNPILRRIANIALWRDHLMTTYCLRNATSLVSMMKEFLDWGRDLGRRQEQEDDCVFYLGASQKKTLKYNCRSINRINELTASAEIIITYIGTMGEKSNPLPLLAAARLVLSKYGKRVAFIFGGSGDLYPQLESEANGLAGVYLTGWLEQNDVMEILELSHIGVSPTTEIFRAFPNKIFTYLSAGLPVISMLQGELVNVLEANKIGISIAPGDVAGLADAISWYVDNPTEREASSLRALTLFNKEYEARHIDKKFADHIERVAEYNLSSNKSNSNISNRYKP